MLKNPSFLLLQIFYYIGNMMPSIIVKHMRYSLDIFVLLLVGVLLYKFSLRCTPGSLNYYQQGSLMINIMLPAEGGREFDTLLYGSK